MKKHFESLSGTLTHGAANETAYLNTIRVLAVAGVIIAHIFININSYYSAALSDIEKIISLFLRNVVNWNVPLFVMITGVIFLNPQKEITLKNLLLKYTLRLVLALFVFGTFYALLEIIYNAHFSFKPLFLPLALLDVLNGKSWDVMWYLYMIIGLYLLLPIFKIFVKFGGKKTLEYALIILFIFTAVLPSIRAITNFDLWGGGGGIFAGKFDICFLFAFRALSAYLYAQDA